MRTCAVLVTPTQFAIRTERGLLRLQLNGDRGCYSGRTRLNKSLRLCARAGFRNQPARVETGMIVLRSESWNWAY